MPKIDWDEINKKLPFEQTEEAKKKRKRLFSDFDPNGNGYLSLAEVRYETKFEVTQKIHNNHKG